MEKWEKNHLSGQFSKGGTGTEHSGTGTGTHFLFLDECSYFSHKLLISYAI